MSEAALDLSKPALSSPHSDRLAPTLPTMPSLPPDISSDSGRASTSSTSSGDDTRARSGRHPSERDSPVDVKPQPMTLSPKQADFGPTMEDEEDLDSEDMDMDMDKSDRIAPIRPFKMYPTDSYSMMNSSLAGMSGALLSPSGQGVVQMPPLGAMPSMLEAATPFALTPMTSHLLQRKRRAENRDQALEDLKKMVPVPEERKDDAYWERRRKNNEAAKRSRDARRQKEEEIAMRAAYLEQENLKLRAQVAILKNETAKLHYMLYNRM